MIHIIHGCNNLKGKLLNPIQKLINQRCADLNLSIHELVAKSRFTHSAVAYRRYNQLIEGNFDAARGLIDQLPELLELPKVIVEGAIEDTKEAVRLNVEAEYRDTFEPHYLIRTARDGRPRQIFIAAFLQASQYISQPFPHNIKREDFREYALLAFERDKKQISQFFYEPRDLVINYSPDEAVILSPEGAILDKLSHAIPVGEISYQWM